MLFEIPPILRAIAGAVEGAVEQRATTSELWQTMREAAAARGTELTGVTIQDVNRLRSTIAGMRNASDLLRSALETSETTGLDQSVTGQMIGRTWWGHDITQQLLSPTYRLRLNFEVVNPKWAAGVPGEPETVTKWVTVQKSTAPSTTAELRDWVSQAKLKAKKDYDLEVVGVANLQLVTV
jgi:hypothetical protein